MKLKLTKLAINDETDLGVSHILGCPDVPSVWNDDAIFFNDEVFIGQINLSELKIDLLPNEGMLYFFFASKSKPYRGIVRYTTDLENLERIDFNCESGFIASFEQEYSIEETNELSEIEILGDMPKFKHYKPSKDEVVLLKFNTMDYPFIDVFKDIDEIVCYLIKKDDLINKRFDKAYLSLSLE